MLNVLESTYTGTCFICSGLAISLILKASLIDAERDFLCYNLKFSKTHTVETDTAPYLNSAKKNDGEAWNWS